MAEFFRFKAGSDAWEYEGLGTEFYRFKADSDAWEYEGLGQVAAQNLFTGAAIIRDEATGNPIAGVEVTLVNIVTGPETARRVNLKTQVTDENGVAQFVDVKTIDLSSLVFYVKSDKGPVSATPLAGGTVDIKIYRAPLVISPVLAPVITLALIVVLAGAAYYLKQN